MAFGHYARILVDIDLSKPLHSDILVERNEFAFYARVEYEKLTHLYDFCKTVDHTLPQCKKKKKKKESQSHQDGKFVIVHLPTGSKATEKEPSAQKNLVVKASTEA